jgi:hypothetical protein
MKRFQDKHKDDFLDLQREFEVKKRSIKPDLSSKVKLKIPVSLSVIYKDLYSKSVMKSIENDKELNGKVNFMADKVLFECCLFKDLFSLTTDHLIEHLGRSLQEKATVNTNTILMVGGFSESPMLFEAVKTTFKEKNVLLPEDAGLAVLKGAVIFGHDRKDINIRISQYTYGFKMYSTYDPMIHPKEKIIVQDDGIKRVRGSFKKVIDIGQKMAFNKISRKSGARPSNKETCYGLKLFASQRANPVFVYEPDCFKIGEIVVDCRDDKGNVGSTTIQLMFGGTEFEVQAILDSTGEKTTATFSFLD